jgi:hypothetical protein
MSLLGCWQHCHCRKTANVHLRKRTPYLCSRQVLRNWRPFRKFSDVSIIWYTVKYSWDSKKINAFYIVCCGVHAVTWWCCDITVVRYAINLTSIKKGSQTLIAPSKLILQLASLLHKSLQNSYLTDKIHIHNIKMSNLKHPNKNTSLEMYGTVTETTKDKW